MKGAGKILVTVSLLSMLLVFYVHEQISLFSLSYCMNTESETLARKAEEYRHLKFEVDQLKAPRLLEDKMKHMRLDLALPKEVRVVRIPTVPIVESPVVKSISLQPLSDGLLDFLGRWVKVAQAKTEQ